MKKIESKQTNLTMNNQNKKYELPDEIFNLVKSFMISKNRKPKHGLLMTKCINSCLIKNAIYERKSFAFLLEEYDFMELWSNYRPYVIFNLRTPRIICYIVTSIYYSGVHCGADNDNVSDSESENDNDNDNDNESDYY